ncbi:MAG TPA: hypothetical protein VF609_07925, partial [Flavisolibacter sp.]
MKNPFSLAIVCLYLFCCSCSKETPLQNLSTPAFQQFIIPKGQHFATGNNLRAVETSELKFVVKFDSSAIYQTTDPENQHVI